jgi:hypothetical protein
MASLILSEQVKCLIQKGKTKEALKRIKAYAKEEKNDFLLEELSLLEARFKKYQNDQILGLKRSDDEIILINQSLLRLTSEEHAKVNFKKGISRIEIFMYFQWSMYFLGTIALLGFLAGLYGESRQSEWMVWILVAQITISFGVLFYSIFFKIFGSQFSLRNYFIIGIITSLVFSTVIIFYTFRYLNSPFAINDENFKVIIFQTDLQKMCSSSIEFSRMIYRELNQEYFDNDPSINIKLSSHDDYPVTTQEASDLTIHRGAHLGIWAYLTEDCVNNTYAVEINYYCPYLQENARTSRKQFAVDSVSLTVSNSNLYDELVLSIKLIQALYQSHLDDFDQCLITFSGTQIEGTSLELMEQKVVIGVNILGEILNSFEVFNVYNLQLINSIQLETLHTIEQIKSSDYALSEKMIGAQELVENVLNLD